MGNHGEVFKLTDGSLWEIQHEYEYLYEYYPQVVVCPSNDRMMVAGKTLNVRSLTNAAQPRNLEGPSVTRTSALIETRIDGDFEGWDGETIFSLQNGQIWQQVSYAYTYHYAFSPRVVIYRANGVYKLRVDGVRSEITVQRLR